MRRREFIAGLGAAATWPVVARAQTGERMRRIGILQGLSANDQDWKLRFSAFQQALAGLGWVEGRNIAFEARYADARPERLPELAAELIRANVDLIVTNAAQPVEAVRKATSTVPIVMATVGDALGAGYVASLARPGGNITGHTLVATEQSAKRLELIKELYPALTHVAVLWNANASGHRLQMKEMEPAALKLGITLQSLPIQTPNEIDAALQTAIRAGAQAVVTMDDPVIDSHRAFIVAVATRQRVPVMGEFRSMVGAGALISYGPSLIDLWRRTASYVDKILKGAKPADLPVEQPVKFELVINLKAATLLGITIPNSMQLLADEVIE
jgi:putative tryptophan/tyrosine transport system substrate-binding protein